MKRKDLFIGGICVAFASLAAVSAIVALGLETKREVFIFWEFIGNLCRGILLLSALWVAAVTILRWKALSRPLRFAGLGPMMSVIGMFCLAFVLDHARPNVKLYVSYIGSRKEMNIEVTTHYGTGGQSFKNGQKTLVSEGRGFPRVLHLSWGTNNYSNYGHYTSEFSKDFDMERRIPEFGGDLELRVTVTDTDARLSPGSEPDGAANGSQPIRSDTNSTSSPAGSRR